MHMSMNKSRLTITVNPLILEKAKKLSEEKHVSLSGLIENFLDFFVDPQVYCFKCSLKFSSSNSEICPKCGWMKCPHCGVCRCDIDEDNAEVIFHMRKVYEDLLMGRVKRD